MQIKVTMILTVTKPISKEDLSKRIDDVAPLIIFDTEYYKYSTENIEIIEDA
ncbi:MAG: hypothetical protein WC365_08355 [Candidatus Babeliales bacterium]